MNFFVTGGSRGIGESIVLQAAREGHGVAFTYLEQEKHARDVEHRAKAVCPEANFKAYQMDVRDSAAVERVGDRVLEEFDSIEVVVCNAAVNLLNLLVQMSDQEWDDVLRTNLTGSFYVSRYFVTAMMAQRFGRLIFISSLGHKGVTGQAAYCASKAGLHGLAAAIAKEYGRKGITANVVVPGFFDTDMSRDGMSAANKEFWKQYCPVGRVGELSEISKVITFLSSEGASFINGQAISVDGGLDWAP
jgi:NAD(P)-dependent dehydrogenase (short-subunit alcohol dehydrogenase family)